MPLINNNLFVEDLSVPMSKVPDMLKAIDEVSKEYDLKIPTIGHAGDGNLHPCISIDGTNPDEVRRMEKAAEKLFQTVIEAFGRIDGLINNVGMNIATGLVDADPGLWSKIIDSNLNGSFLCARKAGQIMRDQKKGKIVSISSIAARRSAPFMGIYGVAKAGIEMMTRVMAQELAPFNIQVNAVAPCMVRTKFSEPFWSNAELHEHIVKSIPMGRIAEPADVAWPVLFLCSEGSDFITGQTVMVDGGASAV